MGVRFSKSIKLGDILKLNLSKSGVSASIGKKGATLNIGNKGTYLNVSPSILGISGTGVSYRKKITKGYGSLLNDISKKVSNSKSIDNKNSKVEEIDQKVIEEYTNSLNESVNVHKLAEKVLNENDLKKYIENEKDSKKKELLKLANDGNEEAIENLVENSLTEFDFTYPLKANFEYSNNILYVDLDLPEIEDIVDTYPTIVKNKVINKNKTLTELKSEYAKTVLSLSIFLSTMFFNISSKIYEIDISGFTTRRNKVGDMVDEYLYSIKFIRKEFENCDFNLIDDAYNFILKFDNRINYNKNTNSFKSITPYNKINSSEENNYIKETLQALKNLGYKEKQINNILDKLKNVDFDNTSDYLKYALNLLNGKE